MREISTNDIMATTLAVLEALAGAKAEREDLMLKLRRSEDQCAREKKSREHYITQCSDLESKIHNGQKALDDLWDILTSNEDAGIRIMQATDRLRATKDD